MVIFPICLFFVGYSWLIGSQCVRFVIIGSRYWCVASKSVTKIQIILCSKKFFSKNRTFFENNIKKEALFLFLSIPLPLIPQSPKHLLPELETIVTRTQHDCYQIPKRLLPELNTMDTRTTKKVSRFSTISPTSVSCPNMQHYACRERHSNAAITFVRLGRSGLRTNGSVVENISPTRSVTLVGFLLDIILKSLDYI